jgi:hypothetical protein
LAHALARSFNFQGRVKKIFYVLTDDKVGAGPRLQPQSLLKPATIDLTTDEVTDTDMDVDVATAEPETSGETSGETSQAPKHSQTNGETSKAPKPTQASTPSAKLAALAVKRKATEPLASGEAPKTRR